MMTPVRPSPSSTTTDHVPATRLWSDLFISLRTGPLRTPARFQHWFVDPQGPVPPDLALVADNTTTAEALGGRYHHDRGGAAVRRAADNTTTAEALQKDAFLRAWENVRARSTVNRPAVRWRLGIGFLFSVCGLLGMLVEVGVCCSFPSMVDQE